jgi:hypothetical protein
MPSGELEKKIQLWAVTDSIREFCGMAPLLRRDQNFHATGRFITSCYIRNGNPILNETNSQVSCIRR